ncbi:hypothetical protein [Pseudooceanicola sp. LIPI14-2-Ac024]|uniref:hypothetical protein n=1 Tax=Pseudooceanicola sp. LIPI14-2-Ac024 TaxID=3344875 RepID=UPI0035D05CDB
MPIRIPSLIGLALFASAAVFWADAYPRMKSAQARGQDFALSDYLHSVQNRVSGAPEASALRHARLTAGDTTITRGGAMISDETPFRKVGSRPLFSKIGAERGSERPASMHFITVRP